jgi:hypothetical protein
MGTGQDGDLQAGVDWPDPRFTVQVDNQTVTDNLSGLMWAKNANLPNGALTWQDALDYVAGMNAGTYPNFGYTDWRLPNRRELRSLADYAQYNMALPDPNPFTNVQVGYWSSTSFAPNTGQAWIVVMLYGVVGGDCDKTQSLFVWPVRAGQVGHSIITTTTTTVGSTTSVPTTTTVVITTTSIISTTTTTGGGSTTTTTPGGSTTTTSVSSGSTTTSIGGATTTTTTTGGGKSCPAKNVLGSDNPQLENLRDFRDSKLAQSAVGRRIINIYYNNADSINAALECSPALRATARRVLEVIAPMMGKKE